MRRSHGLQPARWIFYGDIMSLLRNPEPNWSSSNNSEFTDIQELWAHCTFGKYITCGIAHVPRVSVLFLSWPITQEHSMHSPFSEHLHSSQVRWIMTREISEKSNTLGNDCCEIISTSPTLRGPLSPQINKEIKQKAEVCLIVYRMCHSYDLIIVLLWCE